ncbi:MAG TPA: hypothetical protein VLA02_16900 [Reyranella sp.]|nr:hypothetical protein [Reyranella sp.]
MAVYAFSPLTADDLPLVAQSLGAPHVMQGWPDGKRQVRQIARAWRPDDAASTSSSAVPT